MLILLALFACQAPTPDTDTGGPDTADTGTLPMAEVLTAVTFNAESGDALDWKVAESITPVVGEVLWGMEEVQNQAWADTFAAAAADGSHQHFSQVLGTTGGADKLLVLYDDFRLDLIGSEELQAINVGGTVRAPLVAHFRTLDGGAEFLFVVNHLWRSDADKRHQQAQMLHDWGLQQTMPVLMVGDFNIDWAVIDGDNHHDAGYDLIVADDAWKWVRPETILRTQCSAYYDAVLDFGFVSGEAQSWAGSSVILEERESYCATDNAAKSDHRPVQVTLTLPL